MINSYEQLEKSILELSTKFNTDPSKCNLTEILGLISKTKRNLSELKKDLTQICPTEFGRFREVLQKDDWTIKATIASLTDDSNFFSENLSEDDHEFYKAFAVSTFEASKSKIDTIKAMREHYREKTGHSLGLRYCQEFVEFYIQGVKSE